LGAATPEEMDLSGDCVKQKVLKGFFLPAEREAEPASCMFDALQLYLPVTAIIA